ncbi:MAG: hypothetical protein JWP97_1200 [Labilithrix sp.]|nr:hypothetical protein [Labilithrix sp.]
MADTAEGAWLTRTDIAACDARFGRDQVDRFLQNGLLYTEPPRLDPAGRLVAALGAPGGGLTQVRIRQGLIEVACACSRGRSFVCEHVCRLLVDVAAHEALRVALVSGAPASRIAELISELPALRRSVLEERTLAERLATWLPPRAFDDAFEIDVEPVRTAGLAAAEAERPALVVRHRRPGGRALVKPREVLEARLRPWHRRLVELTAPGHMDKTSLVSTRAQASMLLHLLVGRHPIFTRGFRSRLRFAKGVVAPRLEAEGGRLHARWYDEDGVLVAAAEDALLFSGPFPFLWAEARETFHAVSPDVDLDVAWGLSRVPSLPLTETTRERIGLALLGAPRGLGVAVPGPEAFGLPPLEAPVFELRLTGTPLDVHGELVAAYGAGRVPLAPLGATLAARNEDLEQRAVAEVLAAGLSPEERDPEGPLRAREDAAVTLFTRGLAALRAATEPRFAILVDEALARVHVGPPVVVDVHVGVASGWLETELEFRAGTLKVEMDRLRRVLADRGRWVELTDGTIAQISEQVQALVAEADALGLGTGRGRLAPHHLARVERWVDRYGGELDERAAALASRLRSLPVSAVPALPRGLTASLRPYQARGLAWLQFLRELGAGGVLADDMGLGKTLMTLAHLARWKEDEGPAPSLVVCPTSVVGNWVSEAKRFVPDLRVLVLHGASRSLAHARIHEHDLVVTTYAVLRRDADRLAARRFRCVVLDEAQNVKNAGAAASRAARRLVGDMRLALSGTPIENRLSELWSILGFANPGMLGERHAFEDRFERPIANDPSGEVAQELRAIVRPFVLRRTKTEVLSELPPKTELDVPCVLGLRQKRLYDALSLTLREAVKKDLARRGSAVARLSVLTAILRLRQMACDPRLVDPSASPHDSAKRAAFLELARQLVAEGRRALVFSQFVQLFTLWRADLDHEKIPYEYLDGASVGRDAIVARFQNGTAPLFLVSRQAGGAGLNLTAADTVVHVDPWWNPAVEDQATDRAHRFGQERPVTVLRLVAQGTIEDKIGLLKDKKRELAASIIDESGAGEGLSGLTDDDVTLLLGGGLTDGPAAAPETPELGAPDLARRFVPVREIDELRASLKRIEGSGTPRKELAQKVGLPLARLTLLLIGHRVPISTKAAQRIRAFDAARAARLGIARASSTTDP